MNRRIPTFNSYINESESEIKYTLYLVDYSNMSHDEMKKHSYGTQNPKIFEGPKDKFDAFMQKNYPHAIKLEPHGRGFGNEQWKKYTAIRNEINFPMTPHLYLTITGYRGFSGYIVVYVMKEIK